MRGGSVSSRLLAACCAALISLPLAARQDPTLPAAGQSVVAGPAVASLQLQAVVRGAKGQRAVINGQNLKVGDALGDARLKAIYPRAVLIERQGEQQLLRLAEPIVQPSR